MANIDQLNQLEAEMRDKLYTVNELAEIFGKTRQTIHNWITDGRFGEPITVGEGRLHLIPASNVDKVKEEEAEKLKAELDRLGFQTSPA